MVIKRWKDSKTLQVVSTTMAKDVIQVARRKGREPVSVKPPKEIITHHTHLGGFDCGYQHRLMGAGFASAENFKKLFKK